MRGVRKALPFVDDSGEERREGAEGDGVASGSSSAISRISRECEGVPESVGDYSLEMNSRINVRWKKEGSRVECSRTGERWRTELHEDGKSFIVSEHASIDGAVSAAESVMSDTEEEPGLSVAPGVEEEIESVLEGIDTESVGAVGEAFRD